VDPASHLTSPTDKYESDASGIDGLNFLLGSRFHPKPRRFFTAQILFGSSRLLTGTQKLQRIIERGGRFRLTPLYDIISAYPVMGTARHAPSRAQDGHVVIGKNRHYEWDTSAAGTLPLRTTVWL
jgi:serine/threonine-protein kinase HipA